MKTPIFGNDTQQFHFVGVPDPPTPRHPRHPAILSFAQDWQGTGIGITGRLF
jgi:hypothetical protein